MSKSTLHLDLHPIAHNDRAIRQALDNLFETAADKRIHAAEIIPGKGSGQLLKRVQRYLAQKAVKAQYKRIKVDPNNHGRLFVYFR
jgi:DNA-nicking Smr family endonuclease